MRVNITCEYCGNRHRVERKMTAPTTIYIVCHGCEQPLKAELTDVVIKATIPQAPTSFGGIFSF